MNKFLYYAALLLLVIAALAVSSCNSTKEVVYLQDKVLNTPETISNLNTIKIQPGDQISIVVSCKDPETAMVFNLITVNNQLSGSSMSGGGQRSGSSNGQVSNYRVNSVGDIDFPVLGPIHIAGLTREEVSDKIKSLIVGGGYIKDPIVTVNFVNLHFSIIGDVSSPGMYSISEDKVSIIEALAMAGDLSITGRRDQIFVIREVDGQRTIYPMDLRSQNVFDSPAYYLQQNDVVYVEPNNVKSGQSTVNENMFKSVSFWMSFASFAMAVVLFVTK